MLCWELERVETGESFDGEKYEFPANSAGEPAPGGMFVFRLSVGAYVPLLSSESGNLGGAIRFCIERRLVLDAVRLEENPWEP